MNGYYFEALDAENEPTLWLQLEGEPIAMLRRCELPERARLMWPFIVKAVKSA